MVEHTTRSHVHGRRAAHSFDYDTLVHHSFCHQYTDRRMYNNPRHPPTPSGGFKFNRGASRKREAALEGERGIHQELYSTVHHINRRNVLRGRMMANCATPLDAALDSALNTTLDTATSSGERWCIAFVADGGSERHLRVRRPQPPRDQRAPQREEDRGIGRCEGVERTRSER